jgi:signal transduction histidine kinase
MSTRLVQCDLAQSLSSLESNRDEIPWGQRRDLAAGLGDALADPNRRELAVRLVQALADDTKWEVRMEIALLLPALPDDDFFPLAANLTQDSNGFVRKSAQRALDLRRKGVREPGGRRKGLDHIVAELDVLAAAQGRSAVDKVIALAARLYEESVAATVHDLRGVLTSVTSNVSRLQSMAPEPPPATNVWLAGLDKIARRLAYLQRFVDAMGAYARAKSAERVPERLASVVREAHGLALDAVQSASLDATRIEATISVDEEAVVTIAKHEVVVAISNVLKNAYESVLFGTEGDRTGYVQLSATCIGSDEVAIVIEDNGVGISADDLRVLQAFCPGRTTKKGYGTGFGLPIAYRNVTTNGGSISIQSTEACGTTVQITLPLTSAEGADE